MIVNTWIWKKSVGGTSNPYLRWKNIEIRNNTYKIQKGIGYFDKSEHDLIMFEGKTYVIENLDNQNLTNCE
ncbi:hypothetical protein [Flavobacterium sp. ACN6]|uniref:hypothetical protein n=1 Tax=Flavobacterium sp. ACN6 TaxID=1920426 RepID=UPI001E1A11F1|nr:hypothetical protein [Flavobacterium sp. ACN6]PBJ13630.1 hypothetical protein BSF42_11050 [Flavobacterium sp. ACN6]